MQVGLTHNRFGLPPDPLQAGQQDRHQQGDDGYHDQ
jgi:hypothetical protein